MNCTAALEMQYEVEWYHKHGRHPERVQRYLSGFHAGRLRVLSDFVWNHRHPLAKETIQERLADFVAYRITGIRT